MKAFKSFRLLLLFALLVSCSKDNSGVNNLANVKSQICNSISVVGPTAAYWDYANGIPIPLTQVPILENPGAQFIHSQLPYLGLTVPQGYTAFEVSNPQTASIGVNVIRNDNKVVWRYVPTTTYPGNFTVNDIIGSEINGMFSFYGFNENFDVLCTQTKSVNQSGGIITTFSGRLIRFGEFTGVVWVNVNVVQGLGSSFVAASVSSAPTSEYDNMVMKTFLPLSFQLLVSDKEVIDSDLDGYPDNVDDFPLDPKKH